MRLKVTVEGENPGEFSEAAIRRGNRAGLGASGDYWLRKFLPHRFEPGAPARFGYAARSRKYRADKQAKGLPPLVYTGGLRSLATSEANQKISLRGKGAEMQVRVAGLPEYIKGRKGLLASDRDAAVKRIQAAIARGENTVANQRRLATLQNARTVARFPDIRAEMVRIPGYEIERMKKVYDLAAGVEVRRKRPRRTKKTIV
jgi:hypothetical protein